MIREIFEIDNSVAHVNFEIALRSRCTIGNTLTISYFIFCHDCRVLINYIPKSQYIYCPYDWSYQVTSNKDLLSGKMKMLRRRSAVWRPCIFNFIPTHEIDQSPHHFLITSHSRIIVQSFYSTEMVREINLRIRTVISSSSLTHPLVLHHGMLVLQLTVPSI